VARSWVAFIPKRFFNALAKLEAEENPQTRALPVILLSARAGDEARAEGLDAGATDYIVKPFDAQALIDMARRQLALRVVPNELIAVDPESKRLVALARAIGQCFAFVDQIIAGHLEQPTAIGPDSPWGKVAQMDNGHILFLGCDQDRNTLLHAAEDLAEGAYLGTFRRDYYDENRSVKTLVMERFPGPHRGT